MKETYFFLKTNTILWTISALIHVLPPTSDKWFSRLCLASLFGCTYCIVKAIESKGDKND